MYASKEVIQQAKDIDLYSFLITYHNADIVLEGNSCLLRANRHISVKRNTKIYTDFSTNAHGDSLDYLQKFLGYGFIQAVQALTEGTIKPCEQTAPEEKIFRIPAQADSNDIAINYLVGRGISEELINNLIMAEYIYQDVQNNVIFLNRERSFYELRGTKGIKYHRNGDKSVNSDNVFYFNAPYMTGSPTKIYVCESAIDALSLFELIRDNAMYCSISGIANQQRIDRLKQLPLEPIIAFDNDSPADKARERNADLKAIIPDVKDWNEQLQRVKGL